MTTAKNVYSNIFVEEDLGLPTPDADAPTYRTELRWILPDALEVHPDVQRAFKPLWASEIAKNFNMTLMSPLLVSAQDGAYYVIDGQHRLEAARLAGYTSHLPCKVVYSLNRKEEHQFFLTGNNSRAVSKVERFPQLLGAEDPRAIAMQETIGKYGWKFHRQAGIGHITAIAAVEWIITGSGHTIRRQLLDDVIMVVTRAWGHSTTSVHNQILKGVALVIEKYGVAKRFNSGVGDIDLTRLIKVLSQKDPSMFVRASRPFARENGGPYTSPQAMAKVVVDEYNRGLRDRNRLEPWS